MWSSEERLGPPVLKVWFLLLCVTAGYASTEATSNSLSTSLMETTPSLMSASSIETTSSSTSASSIETTSSSTSASLMETTSSSMSTSLMETTSSSMSASSIETTSSSMSVSLMETTSSSMSASSIETTSSSMSSSLMETTSSSMNASLMETTPSSTSASLMETTSSSTSTSLMETTSSLMSASLMETTSISMSASLMETTSSSMSASLMETTSSSTSASLMETTSSSTSASLMETTSSSMSASLMETTSSLMSASLMETTSSSMSASLMETTSSSMSASLMETTLSSTSASLMETTSSSMSASLMETTSSLMSASLMETTSSSMSASLMETTSSLMSASLMETTTSLPTLSVTTSASVEAPATSEQTMSVSSSVVVTSPSPSPSPSSTLTETVNVSVELTADTTETISLTSSVALSTGVAVEPITTDVSSEVPSTTSDLEETVETTSIATSEGPSPSTSVSTVETTPTMSISTTSDSVVPSSTPAVDSSVEITPSPSATDGFTTSMSSISEISSQVTFSLSTSSSGVSSVDTTSVFSIEQSTSSMMVEMTMDSSSSLSPTPSLSSSSLSSLFSDTTTTIGTIEVTLTMPSLSSSSLFTSSTAQSSISSDSTLEVIPTVTLSMTSQDVPFTSASVSTVETTPTMSISTTSDSVVPSSTPAVDSSVEITPSPSATDGFTTSMSSISEISSQVTFSLSTSSSGVSSVDTTSVFSIEQSTSSMMVEMTMDFSSSPSLIPSSPSPSPSPSPLGPPENLTATAINSSAVNVMWDPPSSVDTPISSYLLEYYPTDDMGDNFTVSVNQTSAVLSRLIAFTNYTITVQAVTSTTGPVTTVTVITAEGVPGPVRNLSLIAVNSTAIRVTWEDPAIINGQIQNFMIEYTESDTAGVVLNSSVNNNELSLSGLDIYTLYNITVSTVTGGGTGDGVTMQKRTLPQRSSPPVNVTIGFLTPDDGNITWSPPTFLNGGEILLYEVLSNLSSGDLNVTCTGEDCVFEFNVTDVDSLHSVEVYVLTNATHEDIDGGSSVFRSEPGNINFIVTEEIPGGPVNVSSSFVNSTAILFVWEDPFAEDTITGYSVSHNSSGSSPMDISGRSFLLSPLDPFTAYRFSVYAITVRSRGFEEEIDVTTEEDAPDNSPANFSVDVINSTEIQVSWQQPPPPINGMIINYVLFVNSSGDLMTLNSTNSSLLITGLTPFTEYYISVAAETNGGRGPSTTPFPVTTNESSPANSPANFSVDIINSTEIQVSWQQPPPPINGMIINYVLFVNSSGGLVMTLNSTNSSLLITGLTPFTEYYISVAAETNGGRGPFTTPFPVTTNESSPANSPDDFSVDIINSTEIQVSWQQPSPPINGMIINYVLFVNSSGDLMTLNSTNSSLLITGLTPFTEYYISVAAETNGGRGPFTTPFPVTTNESQPEAPPQNLTITVLSSTSVQLSWEPPIPTAHNGILRTYRILVVNNNNNNNNSTILVDSSVTTHNISNLTPFTNYSFQVRAENDAGFGPYSEAVNVTTLQDAPANTPANFSVDVINSTEIQVSWQQPPPPINGMIINYVLFVNSSGGLMTLNSTNSPLLITGLTPFTEYYISVAAETNGGRGPFTTPFPVTTNESSPANSPANFSVDIINSTEIQVSWQQPPPPINGMIINYVLFVNSSGGLITLNSTDSSLLITGLTPFTNYYISVAAETNGGRGPFTTPFPVTTNESQPEAPPRNVTITVLSSTSVQLSWEPPIPTAHNGILRTYRILIVNNNNNNNNNDNSAILVDSSVTTHNISNLTPFTNYSFQVRAENNAGVGPYSEAVNVTTLQDAPDNSPDDFSVDIINSTEIQVSWQQPPSPINGMIINYVLFVNSSGGLMTLNSTNSSLLITGLTPFTEYYISVAAETNGGRGPFTTPFPVTTNESQPEAPPRNVTITVLSSTSVQLSWEPPIPTAHNGILRTYRILVVNNNNNDNSTILVDSSVTTHNISNLTPFTNYSFQVRAENDAGFGPYSEAVNVTTLQDVPDPPRNLTASANSSTSIVVKFSSPLVTNGIPTRFEVTYGRAGSTSEESVNVTVQAGTEYCVYLAGLGPFTLYRIRVRAYTSAGPGDSVDTEERTLEGEPSAPRNVRVSPVNSSALRVEWDVPSSPRGIIRFYTVDYLSNAPSENTSANETVLVLGSLSPFTLYSVSVRAFTVAYGNSSDVAMGTTNETIPGIPGGIIEHNFTSMSIGLSWDPPPLNERNGLIINYTIRYRDEKGTNEVSSMITNVLITGLSPHTNYSISVAAWTSVGRGGFTSDLVIATDQDVPGAPTISNTISPNSTSLMISWTPPAIRNGVILTYSVYYVQSEASDCPQPLTDAQMKNTSSLELTIEGLKVFTMYCLRVRAYTIAGGGATSNYTAVRTDPSAASPPNITDAMATARTITINWTTPDAANGRIDGYLITIAGNESNHTSVNLTYTFHSLQPFTAYNITVRAYSSSAEEDPFMRIEGEVTAKVVTTMEDYPSAPTDLDTSSTHVVLVLEWGHPAEPNGVVTGYLVYVDGGLRVTLTESMTKYVLSNLSSNQSYNICVAAVNGRGEGQKACRPEKLDDQTTSPPPVDPTDTTEITLTFSIPEPLRGDAVRYLVLVQPLSRSGILFETQDTYKNVLKAIEDNDDRIPYYIALNESFSNNRGKRDGLDRHTRAASPTQAVTLGNESADSCGDGPCNAPLTPGTQYTMRMDVVDTSGNEFIADMISITTATEETTTTSSLTPVVAGVVVVAFLIVTAVIVTLVVIGVVYYCKWRTKRGHYSPGDLYDNEAIILTRSGNMKTGHSYTLGPEIVPLNQRQNGNGSLIIPNMHSLEMSHKVKLEDLPAHFTSMSADSGYQFSEEYETITDVGLDHSKDASLLTANRAKNRYTNILAYDHSRVKLSYIDDEQGSDYINANYIPGYRNRRAYIATQGPLPCTFDDFWRMVWEHNTAIIVMLTKLNERGRTKCHQYWPEKSDIYSDITITLTSETKFEEWMVREFDLVKDNKKRSILHFQYTAWPDHGVPDETKGAIEFVKGVRSHVQNEHGPLVVHCSAGVGRTGTFIALDTLLQHIKENDHIDIFGLACDMRQHRNHMIQTEAQYVFIHKALLQVVKPTTFTNMRKSTSYHPLSPTLSEEYDSTYEQSQRTQAERYHMEESVI